MSRNAFIALVFSVVTFPICPARAAVDPNGLRWAIWPSAGDGTFEQRLGIQWGILEGYIAPRYDKALAAAGDISTDIRFYGCVSAIDAALATHLLDPTQPLPPGNLYGGLFGGTQYRGGAFAAGLCAGGRLALAEAKNWKLETTAEIQKPWCNLAGKDCGAVAMTGVCFSLQF